MSRIYVDRISPYQSGSVVVDGLNIDTGSLVTTASFNAYTASAPTLGSNSFIGTQNITGSLVVSGSSTSQVSFNLKDQFPASFGSKFFIDFGETTLLNGTTYPQISQQVSNVEVALNGKILGFLTKFEDVVSGPANYYSRQWVGPRYTAWELKPSGSASESTISLFNATNNGTNVVATIKADDVDINGPVTLDQTLKLEASDPLPGGEAGQLAVSASNLYYHNGSSWSQIN